MDIYLTIMKPDAPYRQFFQPNGQVIMVIEFDIPYYMAVLV